jgi:hypothetical protein
VLALVGAFGATLHGGYDLANLANPPASLATDLPSSVDPRGLGTFALTGLALAAIGVLILRGGAFPRPLGYLAFLSAVLLVFVYVGRLVILNPKEPRAARGRGPCRLRRRPGVVRLGRALAAAPECDCGRTTVLT